VKNPNIQCHRLNLIHSLVFLYISFPKLVFYNNLFQNPWLLYSANQMCDCSPTYWVIKCYDSLTKISTLNSRRIHEIYVDYMNIHLFTKYLHKSHVDSFHDFIHVRSMSISNALKNLRGLYVAYLHGSDMDFTCCFRQIVTLFRQIFVLFF